jgi:hypothetical protein
MQPQRGVKASARRHASHGRSDAIYFLKASLPAIQTSPAFCCGRAASNADLSPNLSFVDMGGHGYAVVHVTSDTFETEFVCIPRPLERSDRADGGPLRYRVSFRTSLWRNGQLPRMEAQVLEGDARFSIG